MIRNAISVRHSASIRREEVTRFAYAHTSSQQHVRVIAAAPGPPDRQTACTAAVSRWPSITSITSRTG